jgi:hypothetical protein
MDVEREDEECFVSFACFPLIWWLKKKAMENARPYASNCF